MKIIKKISITLLGFSLAAALFFGCSNSSSPEKSEPTATEETTTTSDTSDEPAESTDTNTFTYSTTYTEPTLPPNVGEDPFKGKTYSSSKGRSYSFGNNGELTDTSSEDPNGGTKYQYTYNANSEELSLKLTHVREASNWCTYSQLVDVYRNYSYSDYVNEMEQYGEEAVSETVFKQQIQGLLDYYKSQFENLAVYKAKVDSSNNFEFRTEYYKTAPSRLPYHKGIKFYGNSNNHSINIKINPDGYGEWSSINISSPSENLSFRISNITSNTINAKEATSNLEYQENGRQLLLNYSLELGSENNLIITLSATDDETTRTWLTDNFNTSSVTLTTSTATHTYTLQQ
ncbi:hypothetical protein [Treponema bryantii]|uniref:hypothetical protein n=1 Tax=Treponema bryantii TaxID=163 RepID=UPI0003B36E2F|nr:hypothetical protein [Treponema bryantii]